MRETSIVDNNCKTQAHVRVCEENKLEELELELEKKQRLLNQDER